jgi:GNAT superfamily N-acetyltransferase
MPPGKNMDDWWTIFRSGLWRLYYKLSHEGKARFYSEFLPLLHRTKHEVLKERDDQSLYLVYIGSKPSARGKGYAKALIQHGLAMVRISLTLPQHSFQQVIYITMIKGLQ